MKIAVVGSMAFAKEMIETKLVLKRLGHTAFVSDVTLGVGEEKGWGFR